MDMKTTINRCIRIFYISKKPSDDEFWEVAKITSIGMIAIGIIGLVMSMIMNLNTNVVG